MRLFFRHAVSVVLTGFFLFGLTLSAQAEGKSIIVLDASGSMWGQIDGRAKLEIAREALATVLDSLPADTELGMIAYGHRTKGDCADIELLVAPAVGTGPAIAQAAMDMQFLGKTPLTEAVRQAASELRSTEEKATVILITDGIETCNADPCALGAELEASGVDFTAHVVGFGLTEDEGKQVACLADNTGGLYIQAKDAGALVDALKTTVSAAPAPAPAPAPEPEKVALEFNYAPRLVLAEGGPEVSGDEGAGWELFTRAADGSRGESVRTDYGSFRALVEPGTYVLAVRLGDATAETEVTVTDDALAEPVVVLNAARLVLHPKPTADGAVDDAASVNLSNSSGLDTTYFGSTKTYVPAGDTVVKAGLGAASVVETLTLAPGDVLERDIVIGTGKALVEGYYAPGAKLEGGTEFVEIMSGKMAIDGSRDLVSYGYGSSQSFDLAAGDYVAVVSLGVAKAEAPFSIKVGEQTTVPVTLNAGVLGVTAPGATSIEVFEAKPDLNGNRTSVSFEYTENTNVTLPAGDFVVVATRGETASEAAVTIQPGERTEASLP